MIEVRWHGRGGQGAFTAARLLGQAVAIHEHKYVQAFPSFGPERRGAPVLARRLTINWHRASGKRTRPCLPQRTIK